MSSGTYNRTLVSFLDYYFISNERIDIDEVFSVMSVFVIMYACQFLV